MNPNITELPLPLRRRMSEIRERLGTDAAHRYAHAALSHLRYHHNVAHMARYVGTPWTLMWRALCFYMVLATLLSVPSYCIMPVHFFIPFSMFLFMYAVARAVAAYLDGGRHDT